MDIEAVSLVVGCVIVFVALWFLGAFRSSLDHLPSKRGLPLIGNLLQANLKRPELSFAAWAKELGGVFRVQMLDQTFVVLSSSPKATSSPADRSTRSSASMR
jgi:hypothetical protein